MRGDDLEPDTTISQAEVFRRRYPDWGRFGLSGYYARSEAEIDDLAADQLERFPSLAIYQIATLVAGGFEVVPTFRTPHVTIAFSGDPAAGVRRLVALGYELRPNPYHEPEPDEPRKEGPT